MNDLFSAKESLIERYIDLLKTHNETTNLYAKSAYDQLPFHVRDCQALASLIGDKDGYDIWDLGSGSGFPAAEMP